MHLIKDHLNDLIALRDNPVGVQALIYDTMEAMSSGRYQMHDAGNPVAMLIEAAAATATAGMMRTESLYERHHPHLARLPQDLYYSVSDHDILWTFARPARIDLPLILSLKEIQQYAHPVSADTKMLRIPKDTEIEVGDTTLTVLYPIDIRLLSHGGIHVSSDLSRHHPIHKLDSNYIDWSVISLPAKDADQIFPEKMLMIKVPVAQMKTDVYHEQVTESGGFAKVYEYEHRLAGVFAYHRDEKAGGWLPIPVAFDQSYSIDRLVIVAERRNGSIRLSIPKIFFTRGIVPKTIRIEITHTQGAVDLSLEKYHPDAYQATWKDNDKSLDPRITAFRSLSSISFFSDTALRGGHDGPSFHELKRRIIESSLPSRQTPILESQLKREHREKGYFIRRMADDPSSRLYAATRPMIARPHHPLQVPMGSTIESMMISLDGLPESKWISRYGDKATLKEGLFLEVREGVLSVMTDTARGNLLHGTLEEVVIRVRGREFYSLPYHYVLDAKKKSLEAYQFSSPKLVGKEYVDENPDLGLEMRCFDVGISELKEGGYRIVVRTLGNKEIAEVPDEELFAQLSYVPYEGADRIYLNARLSGRDEKGAPVFEFLVFSEYHVTDEHELILSGFEKWGSSRYEWPTALKQGFDLLLIADASRQHHAPMTDMDLLKGDAFLSGDSRVIMHERLTIEWGRRLDHLWSRCDVAVKGSEYLTYDEDVYKTWEENVYDTIPGTSIPKWSKDASGKVVYDTILHHKGDKVLGPDGKPILLHPKGGVVKQDGISVKKAPRQIAYSCDLFVVDGSWYLVTEPGLLKYRQDALHRLALWCVDEMKEMKKKLIENTELALRPRRSVGTTIAKGPSGAAYMASRDQSFVIEIDAREAVYRNATFRSSIESMILGVIGEELGIADNEYSLFDMKAVLEKTRNEAGAGVVDIRIRGLGGDQDLTSMELVDADEVISVKGLLSISGEGRLTIQDDIRMSWSLAE